VCVAHYYLLSYPRGVEVLAQKGANVNIHNPFVDEDVYVDGGAPLHLAAIVCDYDKFKLELRALLTVNKRGEDECIKVLLSVGAGIMIKLYIFVCFVYFYILFTFSFNLFQDINSTESNEANTPLHLACYHQHEKSVEILLKGGADVHIGNTNGESALQLAEMAGSTACVSLLKCFVK
jgi:ankyrin repeat protein